jgi:phosphinothricin acetyltransferase
MELTIAEMAPGHWERIREIYLEGLATGQASFETEAPAWETWNKAHLPHSRLVTLDAGRVVAWAALSPVSGRRCYAGVAEVSLYVASSHHGRGVGLRLLEALIGSAEQNGLWTLCASTFPENDASLRLQRACGFRVIGRRERIAQHQGVWRDTVLTERRSRITGSAASGTGIPDAGRPADSQGAGSMDHCKGRIVKGLVDFFGNDFRRITHALEVLREAERIMAERQGWDLEIVTAAALLHDVGIKPSEALLGYNNGKTQEQYGPPVAEELLKGMGFPEEKITKVCQIIGNHHSRSRYDYVELEILKEADRIVNRQEAVR